MTTVEIYNPLENKWTKDKPMCTLRSRVGVSVLNGQLYAIGGYNGVARLDTVEVFDPAKRRWKLVAPMTCQRRYDYHTRAICVSDVRSPTVNLHSLLDLCYTSL